MSTFRRRLALIGLVCIAHVAAIESLACGEVVRIVSPSATATADGDQSARPTPGPVKIQWVFPASDFASLPASHRLLVAINFRRDRTQNQAVERIFPDKKIWMSTTDKTGATMSRLFAENHGSDKTLVQDGLYKFLILGSGPPQGPRDFADGMRFQKPFYYDPSKGNLLVEQSNRLPFSPNPQPVMDQQSTPGFTPFLIGNNPDVTSGNLASIQSVMQFEFAAPPPGDFNVDGTVDVADYVVWRKGLGTTYSEVDYGLWRAHFNETAPSGASLSKADALLSAVPEPSTIALTALVISCLVTCYRRTRSFVGNNGQRNDLQ
jgi:hypothetical protein